MGGFDGQVSGQLIFAFEGRVRVYGCPGRRVYHGRACLNENEAQLGQFCMRTVIRLPYACYDNYEWKNSLNQKPELEVPGG